MPAIGMPCVNEQTVQDLILGRLQGNALDGVERHVATCSSCAALIAVVARRTGSVDPKDAPARPSLAPMAKPSVAVGTVVGRFVIVDFLGAGGMGEVCAAYDPNLERKVAIKFLRPEFLGRGSQDVAAERMRREARLVAKLSHPNVVTVYEVDVFEGRVFIAMEYVDGQSVAEWLKAAPRAVRDVMRVFLAAGAGLAAAHAAGVVHRDFKPHNVMIAKGDEVRVMDFGLAHLDTDADQTASGAPVPLTTTADGGASAPESSAEREARLTRTGTLLGTPAYMAPEQLTGMKASARTDQYSFCVALHEALFGHRPSGAVGARPRATGTSDAVRPAARSVPGWIRRTLKRGLSIDPAQRYASMDDLLADLRADKERRRRIAIALAASLAVVGGGTWGVLHERAARQVRLCRASAATASAIWPFETATAGTISPGPPTAMWEAFQRSGVADAREIFTRVSRTLSAYLQRWAQQATDTCEATHVRREQSREDLSLRTDCLDERLSAARALTDALLRADAKVVTRATDAALGLPDLDRCSNVGLLRAIRPPENAAKQAEVARLRRRMAEMRLLARTGHFESIAADISTLERDIRAVGYPPLLVDFLLLLNDDLANAGVMAEQVAHAREALHVAQSAGYEEGIAQALVGVASAEYRNPSVADLAIDQADAVLHHLGDPVVPRAWLENNMAFTEFWRGHLASALAHAKRSLAVKEQRSPADTREVAIGAANVCLILVLSGKPGEALPHCDRSVELIVSALGWNHPTAMNMVENRALALVDVGRFDEGCPLAERVHVFFEGRGERIDGRTTLLLAEARCAVNRNRPAAARQLLERALVEAKRTGATTMETAQIEWQLARVAYDSGDHARAADFADRAAKRYATLPELAFRDREIREWLTAHRRPDR